MKKLTLNPDMLEVQSFITANDRPGRGTVHAEQQPCTCPTACTCPGCPTCDETCPATCWNTCDDFSCDGSCPITCHETCQRTCYTGRCICYQEP
ncbi:MAG TPA: hypothetical protein VFY65_01430 [Longimicrobium sp.]|nr:hypothetical protein [Longimicrobium sp.]